MIDHGVAGTTAFNHRACTPGFPVARSPCNDFSIGVEFKAPLRGLYRSQYRSLIQLVIQLMKAYPRISADAVGHATLRQPKGERGRINWPHLMRELHRIVGICSALEPAVCCGQWGSTAWP